MADKKYSVLMSVYDKERPDYLFRSMESVMNQTVLPDQFVVVCDGILNEGLKQVLDLYAFRYPDIFAIVQLSEHKGLGIALNAGLERCRNNFVARMDSDDICMPDRMEKQLEAIEREQAAVVSGTVFEFINDIDHVVSRRMPPEKGEDIRKFARRRNPFNHPAVMFRKDCVMAAGGYKDFPWFEDYHLWIRMLLLGYEGYNIQDPVLYMRSGEDMYKRRGGLAYARYVYRFRRFAYTSGFSDIRDFLVSAGGHMLIALAPNVVRKKFYERKLRS